MQHARAAQGAGRAQRLVHKWCSSQVVHGIKQRRVISKYSIYDLRIMDEPPPSYSDSVTISNIESVPQHENQTVITESKKTDDVEQLRGSADNKQPSEELTTAPEIIENVSEVELKDAVVETEA